MPWHMCSLASATYLGPLPMNALPIVLFDALGGVYLVEFALKSENNLEKWVHRQQGNYSLAAKAHPWKLASRAEAYVSNIRIEDDPLEKELLCGC